MKTRPDNDDLGEDEIMFCFLALIVPLFSFARLNLNRIQEQQESCQDNGKISLDLIITITNIMTVIIINVVIRTMNKYLNLDGFFTQTKDTSIH